MVKVTHMKMWVILILAVAFGAIGGLLFGGTFALSIAKQSDKMVTLYAGYIAASLAFIGSAIAIWGVYSQRVLTRRQTTVQHLACLMADGTIQANRRVFIEQSRNGQSLAKWAEKEKIGDPETLSIIAILNDYELIAAGVKRGIYEYDLIKAFEKSTIEKFWGAAHPFILIIRARNGKATLWQEFEQLHDWVSGKTNPRVMLWWSGFQ